MSCRGSSSKKGHRRCNHLSKLKTQQQSEPPAELHSCFMPARPKTELPSAGAETTAARHCTPPTANCSTRDQQLYTSTTAASCTTATTAASCTTATTAASCTTATTAASCNSPGTYLYPKTTNNRRKKRRKGSGATSVVVAVENSSSTSGSTTLAGITADACAHTDCTSSATDAISRSTVLTEGINTAVVPDFTDTSLESHSTSALASILTTYTGGRNNSVLEDSGIASGADSVRCRGVQARHENGDSSSLQHEAQTYSAREFEWRSFLKSVGGASLTKSCNNTSTADIRSSSCVEQQQYQASVRYDSHTGHGNTAIVQSAEELETAAGPTTAVQDTGTAPTSIISVGTTTGTATKAPPSETLSLLTESHKAASMAGDSVSSPHRNTMTATSDAAHYNTPPLPPPPPAGVVTACSTANNTAAVSERFSNSTVPQVSGTHSYLSVHQRSQQQSSVLNKTDQPPLNSTAPKKSFKIPEVLFKNSKDQRKFDMHTIQHVVKFLSQGWVDANSVPKPQTLSVPFILKSGPVGRVFVVFVPYLGKEMYLKHRYECLPFFTSLCNDKSMFDMRNVFVERSYYCPLVEALFVARRDRIAQSPMPFNSPVTMPECTPLLLVPKVSYYLMSVYEQRLQGLPSWSMKGVSESYGWVCYDEGREVVEKHTSDKKDVVANIESDPNFVQLLGLDCEMCETEAGSELTRVSLVDTKQVVLYDSFVKPDLPILDYRTSWSGISASTLENVTVRLADVQEALKQFLNEKTILVGHSIENDLYALKIVHNRIIDTSLLFPHPRPPKKWSLSQLACMYLGKKLDRRSGHSSIEDATTTLSLTLKKMRCGPHMGALPKAYETPAEPLIGMILDERERAAQDPSVYGKCLAMQLSRPSQFTTDGHSTTPFSSPTTADGGGADVVQLQNPAVLSNNSGIDSTYATAPAGAATVSYPVLPIAGEEATQASRQATTGRHVGDGSNSWSVVQHNTPPSASNTTCTSASPLCVLVDSHLPHPVYHRPKYFAGVTTAFVASRSDKAVVQTVKEILKDAPVLRGVKRSAINPDKTVAAFKAAPEIVPPYPLEKRTIPLVVCTLRSFQRLQSRMMHMQPECLYNFSQASKLLQRLRSKIHDIGLAGDKSETATAEEDSQSSSSGPFRESGDNYGAADFTTANITGGDNIMFDGTSCSNNMTFKESQSTRSVNTQLMASPLDPIGAAADAAWALVGSSGANGDASSSGASSGSIRNPYYAAAAGGSSGDWSGSRCSPTLQSIASGSTKLSRANMKCLLTTASADEEKSALREIDSCLSELYLDVMQPGDALLTLTGCGNAARYLSTVSLKRMMTRDVMACSATESGAAVLQPLDVTHDFDMALESAKREFTTPFGFLCIKQN